MYEGLRSLLRHSTWSLTLPRVGRTSGAKKFRLLARKGFFDSIDPKATRPCPTCVLYDARCGAWGCHEVATISQCTWRLSSDVAHCGPCSTEAAGHWRSRPRQSRTGLDKDMLGP